MEEESKKAGLKLNIQISSPITSWQIDGETKETVTNFIFLDPKTTVDEMAAMKSKDACSLWES